MILLRALAFLFLLFFQLQIARALVAHAGAAMSVESRGLASRVMFGVNSHFGLPLVEISRGPQGDELKGGSLKRLGEALAVELGFPVEFLLLPKIRVADSLVAGRVDIVCHVVPLWLGSISDDVEWSSEVLYQSTNILAYLQGTPVKSLKEIRGRSVAALYGFIYQNYDDLFASKELLREDGPSTESNIQKLLKDRVPFVLLSNIEFDFYKKKYSDLQSFDPGWDQVQARCAVSKKSKIKAIDLDKALKSLKKKEFFGKSFFETH